MNTSDYFITNINTLTSEQIRWKIITSNVTSGNTRFPVYRACPYVIGSTGKESPLIIETDKVFTYGVKESPKQEGDGFTYSIPLAMYDLNGPTEHQKNFVEACNKIVESGKNFLLANKESFGGKDWILSDFRKLHILWSGKDSKRPTLYAKLPMENGDIACDFIQPSMKKGKVVRKVVDPLLYRDVKCHVRAAIRIESIFVGSKVSFQTKVHEVIVFPIAKKVALLSFNAEDLENIEDSDSSNDNDDDGDDGGDDQPPLLPETSAEPEPNIMQPAKPRTPEATSQDADETKEPVDEKPKPRRGRKLPAKN